VLSRPRSCPSGVDAFLGTPTPQTRRRALLSPQRANSRRHGTSRPRLAGTPARARPSAHGRGQHDIAPAPPPSARPANPADHSLKPANDPRAWPSTDAGRARSTPTESINHPRTRTAPERRRTTLRNRLKVISCATATPRGPPAMWTARTRNPDTSGGRPPTASGANKERTQAYHPHPADTSSGNPPPAGKTRWSATSTSRMGGLARQQGPKLPPTYGSHNLVPVSRRALLRRWSPETPATAADSGCRGVLSTDDRRRSCGVWLQLRRWSHFASNRGRFPRSGRLTNGGVEGTFGGLRGTFGGRPKSRSSTCGSGGRLAAAVRSVFGAAIKARRRAWRAGLGRVGVAVRLGGAAACARARPRGGTRGRGGASDLQGAHQWARLYINRLLADRRVEHVDMSDAYARLNEFEAYED
jgi:hypothetical protein